MNNIEYAYSRFKLNYKFNFFDKIRSVIEKIKEYEQNKYIDNDLLFILTYLASISTAQISRDKLYEMAANTDYSLSKYFRMVINLTKNWHYDYATAFKFIANKIENEKVKKLFNKLANAIEAGEPDREVLENEWDIYKTVRKDEYLRSLESLRKWTDAYVSIVVSTALISIVMLLAVSIYSFADPVSTLAAATIGTFMFSMFGVFMLYKGAPKDKKTHNLPIKSREQTLINKLQKVLLPIFIIIMSFTILSVIINPTAKIFGVNMKGFFMCLAGLVILPIGILALIDDRKVSKRDEVYTSFIRSLGAIISGAGVTVAEAINRIDEKNLGELKDIVKRLYKRLSMDLDPKTCWFKFMGESGSYLIHKLTTIFVDSLNIGGDADTVGRIVSSANLEMVLLRLKRSLIATGFTNLIIPLHVAMVSLLLFITTVLHRFTELVNVMFSTFQVPTITGNLQIPGINVGMFTGIPVNILETYYFVISMILIFANILAIKVVRCSSNCILYFYGGLLLIITGLLIIIIPPMVSGIFATPTT